MDRGRGRPPDAALAAGHSIPPLRYRRRRRATNGEEDREGVTSGESLGRSLLTEVRDDFFHPWILTPFPSLARSAAAPQVGKVGESRGGGRELKGPLCSTKSSVYVHGDAPGRFQFYFEGALAFDKFRFYGFGAGHIFILSLLGEAHCCGCGRKRIKLSMWAWRIDR